MNELVGRNVLKSGVFKRKEIFVRKVTSEYDGDGFPCDEEPIVVLDNAGDCQIGFIKEYIIQKQRVGELIAYQEEGTNVVHIGVAVCNPLDSKKGYLKQVGRSLATLVADDSFTTAPKIPNFAIPDVVKFIDRCVRYFGRDVEIEIPFWAKDLYINHGHLIKRTIN